MKSLVRKKYARRRFSETANFKDLPLESVAVPVEKDGSIVDVVVKRPAKIEEEVPFDAFTAAKVYDMGIITPINLVNNMTSVDKLEYVQKFESLVDGSMSNNQK